jgi:hypothetical protein
MSERKIALVSVTNPVMTHNIHPPFYIRNAPLMSGPRRVEGQNKNVP